MFPGWVPRSKATSWLVYFAALLYGLTDAAWQTQIYATFGLLYPNEGRVLFMIFNIAQQLGSILSFALPLVVDLSTSSTPLLVQAALVGVSWVW